MKIERHQTQLYLTQEEWDDLVKAQLICCEISKEVDNNNREDELEIHNTAIEVAIGIQNLMHIVKIM